MIGEGIQKGALQARTQESPELCIKEEKNKADSLSTLWANVARSREVNAITERLTAWSERWALRGAYVHCLGCHVGRRHTVAKPFKHITGCVFAEGGQPYPWDELVAIMCDLPVVPKSRK